MKILKNLNWVHEVVNEYANTKIIFKNSIIYGGMIRDIIAKKNMEGDIDLAVLMESVISQLKILNKNYEWKKIQKSIQAISIENKKYKINTHNTKSNLDINTIYNYKNSNNNKILQIITTKNISKLVCNVDFICCGIGMDKYGNIIEYLEGAYDDCINHRLRLNINHAEPDKLINNFKKRLTKLVKRGWIPYNISKDKKILYKKTHIKNKKHKHQKYYSKTLPTRNEFINNNIIVQVDTNITIRAIKNIIIKEELFKYVKYTKIQKYLQNIINKDNCIRNSNKNFLYAPKTNFLCIPYTTKRFIWIKKFFNDELSKKIKKVYCNDTYKNEYKLI